VEYTAIRAAGLLRAVVVGASLVTGAMSSASLADDEMAFNFVGVWMSVDPFDGAPAYLSITPDPSGALLLVTSTAAFSFCEGKGGYAKGTGTLAEGKLVSKDRVVHCEGGKVVPAPFEIVPDTEHGVITLQFASGRIPVTAHRLTEAPGSTQP
jgi:hypothetical protein